MAVSLYDLLKVDQHASQTEIRRAYLELARRYHPDLNTSDQRDVVRFKSVLRAYEVLSQPLQRQLYDVHPERFDGATCTVTIPSRAWSALKEPVWHQVPWTATCRMSSHRTGPRVRQMAHALLATLAAGCSCVLAYHVATIRTPTTPPTASLKWQSSEDLVSATARMENDDPAKKITSGQSPAKFETQQRISPQSTVTSRPAPSDDGLGQRHSRRPENEYSRSPRSKDVDGGSPQGVRLGPPLHAGSGALEWGRSTAKTEGEWNAVVDNDVYGDSGVAAYESKLFASHPQEEFLIPPRAGVLRGPRRSSDTSPDYDDQHMDHYMDYISSNQAKLKGNRIVDAVWSELSGSDGIAGVPAHEQYGTKMPSGHSDASQRSRADRAGEVERVPEYEWNSYTSNLQARRSRFGTPTWRNYAYRLTETPVFGNRTGGTAVSMDFGRNYEAPGFPTNRWGMMSMPPQALPFGRSTYSSYPRTDRHPYSTSHVRPRDTSGYGRGAPATGSLPNGRGGY